MMNVDDLITGAKAFFEAREPVEQPVLMGENLLSVTVSPMGGLEWRNFIANHPPRPDHIVDRNAGYNVDTAVAAYPHVTVTVDGEPIELTAEVDGKTVSRWADLVGAMDAADIDNLAATLWGLNHFEHVQRLLGKAQTPKKPKSSRSRSK